MPFMFLLKSEPFDLKQSLLVFKVTIIRDFRPLAKKLYPIKTGKNGFEKYFVFVNIFAKIVKLCVLVVVDYADTVSS